MRRWAALLTLMACASGCGADTIRLTRDAIRVICAFVATANPHQTVEVLPNGTARVVTIDGGAR